jgi:hypothetical protein
MTQGAPQEQPVAAGLAVDPTVPSPARVWNFWVGGKDHFEADRALAEQFGQVVPQMPLIARLTRQFISDTVTKLAADGIRQFLDIGTGLPTADNTHEVAQRLAPDSRIVYVDNDPVVLAHARALLTSSPAGKTAYLDADLRRRAATWESCTAPATSEPTTCRRRSDATTSKPRPSSTLGITNMSAGSSTAWN